jgi:hypothetical protein
MAGRLISEIMSRVGVVGMTEAVVRAFPWGRRFEGRGGDGQQHL